MSIKPIKFALAGCGRLALQIHIPLLRRLPGVELVAVADIQNEALDSARALAPNCVAFHTQTDMLDGVEADAVIIAVPTDLHAHMACEAFRRGKHVYLEKPIASNLAEAEQIIVAWKRAGVIAVPGFNYRFHPLVRELRRLLDNGRIGALLAARTTFSIAPPAPTCWRASRTRGGGALLDLATHHADLIRFIFRRDIAGAQSSVRSICNEDDCVTVQFHLQDNFIVQSFFSECGPELDSFEVFGEYGSLAFDRYFSEDVEYAAPGHGRARLQRLFNRMRSFAPRRHWLTKVGAPIHEPSYQASLSHFISAIRGNSSVEYDLMDGYKSIAAVAAAQESAACGRLIECDKTLVGL